MLPRLLNMWNVSSHRTEPSILWSSPRCLECIQSTATLYGDKVFHNGQKFFHKVFPGVGQPSGGKGATNPASLQILQGDLTIMTWIQWIPSWKIVIHIEILKVSCCKYQHRKFFRVMNGTIQKLFEALCDQCPNCRDCTKILRITAQLVPKAANEHVISLVGTKHLVW